MKLIILLPIAFLCELIDSSLGMGYGTTLTPILLLMGFDPIDIVPAVLMSEFISGILASTFHHSIGNVNFKKKSKDLKVALILGLLSIIGVTISVFLSINLSVKIIKIIIGCIILSMGFIIILTYKVKPKFSWTKISLLGIIASFNKGISGGGYGPTVMGGQILSGVGVKNAVGITALAEGITCFVGFTLYYFLNPDMNLFLAPWIMAGAVLSVPIASNLVKILPEKIIKLFIAIVIFSLGILTLLKAFHII
ncbi:MAG: sulfite exporter TauE/SafE family protein [Candidatus Mcinerneyibacterium aminivorans]|uniref:Probable membrane transporter protein n=1 Tax=Candidatus Mcinerneyibacterium aminivorans TaxID=2703815 RepID=A0A5D0MFG3_9BACT|nr:MAG: sulfite exporter TauE/SafE family protein [Candidatus Mcinerneyibacterium aminivorans]